MTPEHARLVREAWATLAPVGPRVAAALYQRLVDPDPAVAGQQASDAVSVIPS